MPDDSAGFWSYVQQDDSDDFGRILALAQQLRAAFRLQTASDLQIFVDRESLQWGDEWQARIDNAIAGTTFFIPVITPSYFRSAACRRELLKFTREATRLGLEQLILPIYWVSVPELDLPAEDISDEAIAAVSRFQWQDFRDVRLEEERSSAFRRAVHALAEDIARRVSDVIRNVEDVVEVVAEASAASGASSDPATDDDEAPGLLDKLAASEETWPVLTDLLTDLTAALSETGRLATEAGERAEADAARGGGIKSRLLITERLAHQLAEPAATIEELGHRYASLLLETDPGIRAMLDVASDTDPGEERDEFLQSIQDLWETAEDAVAMFSDLVDTLAGVSRLSRSLRAPLSRMRTGAQAVIDGRDVIEEWGRRAAAIRAATPTADTTDSNGSTPEH